MNNSEQDIINALEVLKENKSYIQSFEDDRTIAIGDYELELNWGICIFIESNLGLEIEDFVRLYDFQGQDIVHAVGSGSPRSGIPNLYRVEERWELIDWIIETLEEKDVHSNFSSSRRIRTICRF